MTGGEGQQWSGNGVSCVIGSELFLVLERDKQPGLYAIAADATKRTVAEPFAALDADDDLEACGRYRDRYVFVVRKNPRDYAVVVAAADGTRLHRIPVAGDFVLDDYHKLVPSHAFFVGDALPRFVPYPEVAFTQPDKLVQTLAMIDLETGAVAWRSKPTSHLGVRLFRAGSHWVWLDDTTSVFDGATGKLVGAVRPASKALVSYSLRVATDTTLWLQGGTTTTPDRAPVVALDLATLQPKFPPRFAITDATTEVRTELGIP